MWLLMSDPVGTYLTVLLIGVGLTILVGQVLMRSARPFLEEVFERPETANSVARLLVLLFHLVVLGVLALVVSIDFTFDHPLQTIVVKLGLVLLVLGIAHGSTLVLLTRLRTRRRLRMEYEEKAAQAAEIQAQQYGQHSGPSTPPSPPSTGPAQTYPAVDRRAGM
jgi:hypothetical protein